ncbi:hypothetical protein EV669_105145 [Gulbenkiania mobilis]|uniref:Uncharacterized protein n=1 Tax=Gulbenkiania mobilis TaxID=397457 RepID=A0ABY2CW34_GULMO|nr:hypothetical protein EV669_105145 [Gulbenkiania mobilis]
MAQTPRQMASNQQRTLATMQRRLLVTDTVAFEPED